MQQKFISNLLLIIALNLLVKPLAIFGIDAAVQNRVGSEEYGMYFSLLNFTFLFNILLDLGINNYTTKNVAQHPEIVPKYLGKVLVLRLMLFVLYAFFTTGLALVIGYEMRHLALLGFLILNQFFITIIAYIRSHFAGMLHFKTDALISVLDRILLILFCGILLYGSVTEIPFKIEWFVWIQTVCYGLTFSVACWLLLAKLGRPKVKFHKPFSLVILRQSLPYALLILLMMIYTRTDSVMIERLHPNGKFESGIYAQGFRLLDAFFMFGMIFTNLLFPLFSRMLKHKDSIENLLRLSSKLLIWGAISLAIFMYFNAHIILSFIYSEDVDSSTLPFQLLMFTFIGMCVTLIYGTLLTANGNLKFLNRVSGVGIIANVIINAFLIPSYGAVGAAIATLITQSLVGVVQWYFVHQNFSIPFSLKWFLQLIAFCLVLSGGLYSLNIFNTHWLLQLAYVGSLLVVFKVAHPKELKSILLTKEV